MDNAVVISNKDLAWAAGRFSGDRRQQFYKIYREYVSGVQPVRFATGRFKDAFGAQFETFAYNRTDSVVDAITDRLKVIGFDSPHDAGSLAGKVKVIWDDNSMDYHEDDVEAEMLTSGDAYVVVEQDLEDAGRVNIWPQEARNIRVRYSSDHPGRIEMAARWWLEGEGDTRYHRMNLYYRDRIEKYRSRAAGVDLEGSTAWVRYQPDTDKTWPVVLPVKDTVPVFHFANNARMNSYGVSELASVIPIQDALNKAVMDLLVGMEFSAFRQRVVLNVDIDEPGAEERIQQLEIGMNRLITLVGTVDGPQPGIAEFSATDVRQFVGPIDQFDTMISRVSKIPVHYLQMTGGFESGESRRMAEAPFISKVERLQTRMGDVLARVMVYAARLREPNLKIVPGALEVKWSSAMPMSERETLEHAIIRRDLGIPLVSNLKEMGKDQEYIDEILLEQDAESARSIDRFNAGNIDAFPARPLVLPPVTE